MPETRTKKQRRATKAAATAEAAAPDGAPGDGPLAGPLDAPAGAAQFLAGIERGEPWYPTLLSVIARWTAATETVDGVVCRYLLAGEAFDWLLLAQRLTEAAEDVLPADEVEQLLFYGHPPDGSDEEAFARAIGYQKYRAHLNFQYGVVVEEALLLSAELELQKARTIEGPRELPADLRAYERVYGVPMGDLLARYRADTGMSLAERSSQPELQAFTYWCSKYRLRHGEPARVASDTRKALALLSRLSAEGRGAREGTVGRRIIVDMS